MTILVDNYIPKLSVPSSEDIAFNSLYHNWSYILAPLISPLKGEVFLWRHDSAFFFAVHQKISRNLPRNPAAPITRQQPLESFFFLCALCVRVGFSVTLLRFISLNARVISLVRSRRVDFRQGRKIDTSGVGISRTWAQLRKTWARTFPRKGNFLHFSPRSSIELGAQGSFPPWNIAGINRRREWPRSRPYFPRFSRHSGEK